MLRGKTNRKILFVSSLYQRYYIGLPLYNIFDYIDSLPLTYPACISLFKVNIETPKQCVKFFQIWEKRNQKHVDGMNDDVDDIA